ncbi:MAG TPA: hypothetical protein VEI02_14295 [Planctomycetota bacterium]|nr:hypothetical protein [Planctomycetota bacterium]
MNANAADIRRRGPDDEVARLDGSVRAASTACATLTFARLRAAMLMGLAAFTACLAAPSVEGAWRRAAWSRDQAAVSNSPAWAARVPEERALAKAREKTPAPARVDFDRALAPAPAATASQADARGISRRATRAALGLVVAFAACFGAAAFVAAGRRGGGALAAVTGAAVVAAVAWTGIAEADYRHLLSENAAAVASRKTDFSVLEAWILEAAKRAEAGETAPPPPDVDFQARGTATWATHFARDAAAAAASVWKYVASFFLVGTAGWFLAIPLVERRTTAPWLDANGRRRLRVRAAPEARAAAPGS